MQLSAPAADQVPAAQLLQFVFKVCEQAAARYLPAAQTLEAQALHGAMVVVFEYVLPATHATQARCAADQPKPALQRQAEAFTAEPMAYSAVAGHCVHCASPASEK